MTKCTNQEHRIGLVPHIITREPVMCQCIAEEIEHLRAWVAAQPCEDPHLIRDPDHPREVGCGDCPPCQARKGNG